MSCAALPKHQSLGSKLFAVVSMHFGTRKWGLLNRWLATLGGAALWQTVVAMDQCTGSDAHIERFNIYNIDAPMSFIL